MKLSIFKSLVAATALCGMAAVSGCQDSFDTWNLQTPVAAEKANISIMDFKQEFWQTDLNYCSEIPARADGSHYIVSGRVISSDEAGNVFKSLYIQDETGVLPISINQYSLYIANRVGQEIVLDLTGMYAGKYRGMFQLGFPSWNESFGVNETSFMAPEFFTAHRQYNGNPEVAKVDTITISDLSEINSDVMKWQGQLVRFNNATFANAGNPADNQLVDKYHSSGYNQTLNVNGGTMAVRTSGYADFWNMKLPAEACDVVGILGYYQSSESAQPGTCWQLVLNDAQGIMNIGNPTAEGIKTKPYTVDQAIAKIAEGFNDLAWVKGYIVGTIAPEVKEVKSNADIQWAGTEPYIMDNYLVIAQEPGVRNYEQCILVPLPAGSALYTYGNLADSPALAGRTLNIRGRFTREMGMPFLTANSGTPDSFEIEGVEVPGGSDPEPTEGDGSEASPYSVAQAIANNSGTAWVKGYIIGCMNSNNNYTLEVAAPFTVASNVYLADNATETETSKMLPVQLVSGTDIRKAVNLVDNPANFGKQLSIQGSLEKYFSQPGLKTPTAYKLDGAGTEPTPDPTPGNTVGQGTEADPYTCADVVSLNSPGTKAWVKGYIIGSMNTTGYKLEVVAPFTVASNVYIADSATETDEKKMVPVQLVSGTDIRKAVNLVDNAGNLGKLLTIEGSLEKYFQQPGLKSPTAYKL